MKPYTIGRVARETGCRVQTLRYYEEVGLLRKPKRTDGGQRRYERADVDRVNFIRHCRELGFSIESVRDLVALADAPTAPCADADRLCAEQIENVRGRVARLTALGDALERVLAQCRGGRVETCSVIEALSSHGACAGHAGSESRFGRA